MALALTSSLWLNIKAMADSEIFLSMRGYAPQSGEILFLEHAEQCLAIMEQAAQKMTVNGAAVIAFIPGDDTHSWISKMKEVGALTNGSANFLAIAYSKAAEMADTYQNSGGNVREPLFGEHGFEGGLIKKVKGGYILAVFSGATGEQDTEIAKAGLEWLVPYFQ